MYELKSIALKSTMTILLALSTAASGAPAYADSAFPEKSPQQTPGGIQNETKMHHRHFHGGYIVKDTAEMLGVEPKTVFEQLKQGKTLLQIVQAKKGWSEDEYVKKLTEAANQKIDQALTEGKIDQEKAVKIKARLPEKLKSAINRSWKDSRSEKPTTQYRNNQINWSQEQH